MAVEPLESRRGPAPAGPYAPAVRAGGFIVVSGQVGVDPTTGELVEGGTREQAVRALANLGAVLADAGIGLEDVAKTTVFITDVEDFPVVNEAYAEAFGYHRPARSTVGVAALPLGARVEVEAWAVDRGA